ncbi:Marvel domain-containing protein [Aphelenchoides fujianensis]|nr:Marvel domain-containing protein [Aphelenchoides fujianensis]
MPFIENVNKDQLKVPLGFIKLPQLVLAVIAFTSRSGWEFVIQYLCANGDKKVETFDDFAITDRISKCGGGEVDKILDVDHTMAARFFGLVAVVSIIFVLIMLYVYLCKWGKLILMIDWAVFD